MPDPTPPTQDAPVPDYTTPTSPVVPVPDTTSPTTSTPTVVDDYNGLKWYDYEDVIYLDDVPSLQRKFTNQFGDYFYPKSGVWMSSIDD